ncbi:hypothetical protein [Pseudoduganella sp. OTU4001]|uniref:hypothetical protein n=1 Tax=Pseudoduganella sp. OTU4001 TaxID=3043854 RepID=UPI00313B2ACE
MSDLLHISSTLVRIIARINPKIWEVVGGGPLGKYAQHAPNAGIAARMNEPDPVPWRQDQAWLLESQFAAIDLGRRQVDAACAIYSQGGDVKGFLKATLDDWCGTGQPRLPFKWPSGIREPRPPRPNELDALTIPLAGAIAIIVQSESVADEALSKLLADTGAALLDKTATYATEHFRKER